MQWLVCGLYAAIASDRTSSTMIMHVDPLTTTLNDARSFVRGHLAEAAVTGAETQMVVELGPGVHHVGDVLVPGFV